MKKFFAFLFIIFIFLLVPKSVFAATLEYQSFDSDITINKDTSVTVIEKIKVNFFNAHHGIFRNIPANLKVLFVKNDNGTPYKFQVSGNNVKEIKIGDPDRTITGDYLYVISYLVKDAIKEFPDHYELYWNVTGSDWEESIPRPTALVHSDFAKITKTRCFAGSVGTSKEDCTATFTDNTANFSTRKNTGVGSDFTIVVALDKNNSLIFPSSAQKIGEFLLSHWPYFLTTLPFLLPLYFWFKKGRDQRYISDNIYYEPDVKTIKTVSFFDRKFIPLVYAPIKGLTPAQVGTLLDQKVDIADVVAEITELARLKYLKMKKIPKKGLFGKDDYEFTNLNSDVTKLADYQQEIMDGLFASGDKVLLSSLKNKFYTNLKSFKDKLYENMKTNKFFDDNPEKVRQSWLAFIVIFVALGFFFVTLIGMTPIILLMTFSFFGFLVTRAMPRRTAHGYALFRQIEGLKWYINKGLWRHEIAEKHLFIDEILPLAISLGVINKLSKDMEDLDLEPPTYVSGMGRGNFVSSFSSFQSNMGSTLTSSPSSSGGGSGFSSGGSSGGGGGGGGGGGW